MQTSSWPVQLNPVLSLPSKPCLDPTLGVRIIEAETISVAKGDFLNFQKLSFQDVCGVKCDVPEPSGYKHVSGPCLS